MIGDSMESTIFVPVGMCSTRVWNLIARRLHASQLTVLVCYAFDGSGSSTCHMQVDLAHGSDYDWVANTLQHLCLDMGTVVVRVTDDSGVQLVVGRPE